MYSFPKYAREHEWPHLFFFLWLSLVMSYTVQGGTFKLAEKSIEEILKFTFAILRSVR